MPQSNSGNRVGSPGALAAGSAVAVRAMLLRGRVAVDPACGVAFDPGGWVDGCSGVEAGSATGGWAVGAGLAALSLAAVRESGRASALEIRTSERPIGAAEPTVPVPAVPVAAMATVPSSAAARAHPAPSIFARVT